MFSVRKVNFLLTLMFFIVFLTSCTRQVPPEPTQSETTAIPYAFTEGFSYITELKQYQYHSIVEVDQTYSSGFNKISYHVLFADPFLKAYGINGNNEVTYRIAKFDEKLHYVYKNDDNYIKADVISDELFLLTEFDHPIFFLLKKADRDIVTEQNDVYEFSFSYDQMIDYHPFIIQFIDSLMEPELDKNTDIDVSDAQFDITVRMNQTNPKSFQSITIDFKEYLSLAYPLSLVPQDQYTKAKLTFEFAYNTYEKDITPSMDYSVDDQTNFYSPTVTELTIDQETTSNIQYLYDIDCFKIILTVPKTLTYSFTGSTYVLNYRLNEDGTKMTALFPGNDYDFEVGTYYICIQNISEETGTVTFSFNKNPRLQDVVFLSRLQGSLLVAPI